MQSLYWDIDNQILVLEKDNDAQRTWYDISSINITSSAYDATGSTAYGATVADLRIYAYSGSIVVASFPTENTNLYYYPFPDGINIFQPLVTASLQTTFNFKYDIFSGNSSFISSSGFFIENLTDPSSSFIVIGSQFDELSGTIPISLNTPYRLRISGSSTATNYSSSLIINNTSTDTIIFSGSFYNNEITASFSASNFDNFAVTFSMIDLNVVSCSTLNTFTGGSSYPFSQSVVLGSLVGTSSLVYDAYSIPDRFIVDWDSTIRIDTGYRGATIYDFGGSYREAFTSSLVGLVDPITFNTYPDLTTYPDDGYPRIYPGNSTSSFIKNISTPTIANVNVYAPMGGTAWEFTLQCPI